MIPAARGWRRQIRGGGRQLSRVERACWGTRTRAQARRMLLGGAPRSRRNARRAERSGRSVVSSSRRARAPGALRCESSKSTNRSRQRSCERARWPATEDELYGQVHAPHAALAEQPLQGEIGGRVGCIDGSPPCSLFAAMVAATSRARGDSVRPGEGRSRSSDARSRAIVSASESGSVYLGRDRLSVGPGGYNGRVSGGPGGGRHPRTGAATPEHRPRLR